MYNSEHIIESPEIRPYAEFNLLQSFKLFYSCFYQRKQIGDRFHRSIADQFSAFLEKRMNDQTFKPGRTLAALISREKEEMESLISSCKRSIPTHLYSCCEQALLTRSIEPCFLIFSSNTLTDVDQWYAYFACPFRQIQQYESKLCKTCYPQQQYGSTLHGEHFDYSAQQYLRERNSNHKKGETDMEV